MDREAIDFVLQSLPRERTVWHSFPHHYALLLFKHVVGDDGRSIADIKTLCARRGDRKLKAEDFENP